MVVKKHRRSCAELKSINTKMARASKHRSPVFRFLCVLIAVVVTASSNAYADENSSLFWPLESGLFENHPSNSKLSPKVVSELIVDTFSPSGHVTMWQKSVRILLLDESGRRIPQNVFPEPLVAKTVDRIRNLTNLDIDIVQGTIRDQHDIAIWVEKGEGDPRQEIFSERIRDADTQRDSANLKVLSYSLGVFPRVKRGFRRQLGYISIQCAGQLLVDNDGAIRSATLTTSTRPPASEAVASACITDKLTEAMGVLGWYESYDLNRFIPHSLRLAALYSAGLESGMTRREAVDRVLGYLASIRESARVAN